MNTLQKIAGLALLGIPAFAPLVGCSAPMPTPPLGRQSDAIWCRQELAGSASDFVIYEHEFIADDVRLNLNGEDHLQSIAARLKGGAMLPVVVERSMTSINPESEYKYPVNGNVELDMNRREMIVRLLTAMGVPQAEGQVVVVPAMTNGLPATQAAQSLKYGSGVRGPGGIGGPGGPALPSAGVGFPTNPTVGPAGSGWY